MKKTESKRFVWMNEDNEHFYTYGCHGPEDMTEEGCRNLVRTYARTGAIGGVLYCINLQRALFDSAAWERFRDVQGGEQHGYVDNVALLAKRGVDQFAVWLDETRRQGMEAWLTMRMNDSHGLKEAVHRWADAKICTWHSKMWAEHPEWRRAPYRDERSWEGSYDFGHEEIRRHHLALVKEAFDRWDFDGIEFDWLRWGMFFRPGAEREGARLLTGFVREIGAIRKAAEKRVNHRIQLGHRIPMDPRLALNHGFDVAAWAEIGCVDMVTLSTFGNTCDYEPPIGLWRRLLATNRDGGGQSPRVNVAIGPVAEASPLNRAASYDYMRGAAACAWAAGADGVYLFNECYREPHQLAILEEYLQDIRPEANGSSGVRKVAVTMESQAMPGDSLRQILPMPLTNRAIGADFTRMEQNMTFRLPMPGTQAEGDACRLEVVYDADVTDEVLAVQSARLNTKVLKRTGIRKLDQSKRAEKGVSVFQLFDDGYPREAASVVTFDVPWEDLVPFYNAIEVEPPAGATGRIVWVQFVVERC